MFEGGVVEGARIEGIDAVDEGEPLAGSGGLADELAQNERAAPGSFGRAKFCERGAREAARKRFVERGEAGGPDGNVADRSGFGANADAREFFGEELANLDNVIHGSLGLFPPIGGGPI